MCRKVTSASFENLCLVLGGFWFWKAVCMCCVICLTWQTREQAVLVTSCLSLFVSCLSLIITRAVEMIGWKCTKIRAEQSQRGDHRDPRMDTLVSLALAIPTASPFRPSILPFSWGSISCAEEVPGARDRSVVGGMSFSLSFHHSWDYETPKGTCMSQGNVSITASVCSAGAAAALESIPVTLGSRCHLPASVFKDRLPPFHQLLGVE